MIENIRCRKKQLIIMLNLNEIDWFKLLLALIPAGGLVYSFYLYLQNNLINNYWYINIYKAVIISSLLITVLLIYIFFKCFAEIFPRSVDILGCLTSYINRWVKISISLSIALYSILIVFMCVSVLFQNMGFSVENSNIDNLIKSIELTILTFMIVPVVLLILLMVTILVINIIASCLNYYLDYSFEIPSFYFILDSIESFIVGNTFFLVGLFFLVIISVYIWFIPVSSISCIPLPGQVIMEENSNSDDMILSFLIKTSGPNTGGVSIKLLEANSTNLHQKSTITNIESEQTFKIYSNDSLFVNSLGNGKYNARINTSNLNKGYYQLKCEVKNYSSIYNTAVFIV